MSKEDVVKAVRSVERGLLLSVWRKFFPTDRLVGMMCPADEASLIRRLRRIK